MSVNPATLLEKIIDGKTVLSDNNIMIKLINSSHKHSINFSRGWSIRKEDPVLYQTVSDPD